MLPAYSRVQDEKETLKEILKKSVKLGIYVIAPLMLGLLAIADVFVDTVLTEKWEEMVPFIRIWCLVYLTRPFESSCHQAILGLGRSDITFKIILTINIIQFSLTMLAIFVLKNVLWVAIGILVATWVSIVCFSVKVKNLIGYRFIEQLIDILPSLLLSALMGIAVYLLQYTELRGLALLLIQILTGAAIYVSLSVLFKLEPYIYLKNLLKEKLLKKSIPTD
jgi:O-antigen/teichoic acid export membrane protein